MRIRITSVKALEKYKIHVYFDDGTDGVLDLSSHAGKGVFTSWQENENFSKVFISKESGVVSWPGDIDIDTYNSWVIINNISPEDYFKSQKKYAGHL